MKRHTKRVISLLLSAALALGTMSGCLSACAANEPYIDSEGFHRNCNGEWLTFDLDYTGILKTIEATFLNRESSVTIRYACPQTSEFAYEYTPENMNANCKSFISKTYSNVFKQIDDEDDPYDGEYLYHTVTGITYSWVSRPNQTDIIDGVRWTNYEITFSNITYYTTVAQENDVKAFVSKFNTVFDTASHTPYERAKIIYDFVVRNIVYDEDVYLNKYPTSSQRFKNSRSAYGAIKGSLLSDNGSPTASFNWDIENFILDENIISRADQGMAVCQGIAKLFYVLCISNGIPCRFVDGDYASGSGKSSDPHEWLEVRLDDGRGLRWYLVDPTFAIQRSIKAIHYNNYDYFLKGSDSDEFCKANHQQAYSYKDYDIESTQGSRTPLYNMYTTYKPSVDDYQLERPDFTNIVDSEAMILIERSYTLNNKEYGSYILTNSSQTRRVEFDENGVITRNEEVKGFVYNGLDCSYRVWIPYLVNTDVDNVVTDSVKNVDEYTFMIVGKGNTVYNFSFNIIPYDMTANFIEGKFDNDRYSKSSSVATVASYTGNTITPHVNIIDGNHNQLVRNTDYMLRVYSDAERSHPTTIKNIGKYYIDVVYRGNYSGKFMMTFEVGKIDLSIFPDNSYTFPYMPRRLLADQGITTPAQRFMQASRNGLTVGDYRIMPDIDFTASSSGKLTYGATGTVTMTGKSSSDIVSGGTKKVYSYVVSGRFDISALDGTWAQTTPFYTTGGAVAPSSFTELNKRLEKDIDYKIVGYKNNVKPGKASVMIQGINGCIGSAEMYFQLADDPNRIDIKNATMGSYSNKNNKFEYQIKCGSKVLVRGVDYSEKISVKDGLGVITCTGTGAYKGTYTINLPKEVIAPTASGNYIKVSDVTYTGKALTPAAKLYNSAGKRVNDFFVTSVAYSKNTNVGSAKVSYKLYNGKSVSQQFKINPPKTSISSLKAAAKGFTVKWAKKTNPTTGYQLQYSLSSDFSKPTSITIKSNKTTSYTVKKLKAKKAYYVRIRTYKTVGSTKYYSAWSASKKVKTK